MELKNMDSIIEEIIELAIKDLPDFNVKLSELAREFLLNYKYPLGFNRNLRDMLVNNWGVNTWDNFKLGSAEYRELKERADAYDQIVRGILFIEKMNDWRAYLNWLDDEKLAYVFADHWGDDFNKYQRLSAIDLLIYRWLSEILEKDILFNPPKNY